MVDGTALLMAPFYGAEAMGFWSNERGTNLLDSGAPFYDVYRCADGGELAVGALEPPFFAILLDVLGLDAEALPGQHEVERWPELQEAIGAAVAAQPLAHWVERAEGRDACMAPVLPMRAGRRASADPGAGTVVEVDGVRQPAPAPRFSATPARLDRPPAVAGQHTDEVLADCGFTDAEVADLRAAGVLGPTWSEPGAQLDQLTSRRPLRAG